MSVTAAKPGQRAIAVKFLRNLATRATDNSFGEQQDNWQPFGQAYVRIESPDGGKSQVGTRVEPAAAHSLLAPWVDAKNVTTAHRVLMNGRQLEIVSATNVGELNVDVRLLCNEAKS